MAIALYGILLIGLTRDWTHSHLLGFNLMVILALLTALMAFLRRLVKKSR